MCNNRQDTLGWVHRELCHKRYQITEKFAIVKGAELYRAWDRNTQTSVVVKVMSPTFREDSSVAGQFLSEMESLIGLSHPHLVQVFDVGQEDDLPFVVVQDVPGENLLERRPGLDKLVAWLRPVSETLDWLDARGFVHGDLRPGIILFDAEGRAYVSEPGIVKRLPGAPEHQQGLADLVQNYLATINESPPEAVRLSYANCAALADSIEQALEADLLCLAVN